MYRLMKDIQKSQRILPILPNEIIAELERMNVKIKTPMLIQKIETLRHEVTLKEGLLVLDETTFYQWYRRL